VHGQGELLVVEHAIIVCVGELPDPAEDLRWKLVRILGECRQACGKGPGLANGISSSLLLPPGLKR
jgi:hypothetical protein